MALSQADFSLSSDTPRMVKFFVLNRLNALTTLGFSWRQGPHQLAQKSTSKYLPRKDEMEMVSPVTPGKRSSGAGLPTNDEDAGFRVSCCAWACACCRS